ncbi:DUF2218 domain-containing protein [Paracoccus sp. M683]|uniref:DUF2218 domain-containing protein n=1 Tax=Paracoccus sp. M683 TaxID=2594268 RepID=UPI0011801B1F|nr:DUF2218 domain-containing protein [Paracoccus sp. M683]TRW97744.1 DUF2218 domain-containing protein [Paracoccus sp. M683]
MQDQFESIGRFETPNAQKYLVQLCKHFAHKIPAEVEGDQGHITFAMGTARLSATDASLDVVVTGADDQAVNRLQQVIEDHLKRFAFREAETSMIWAPATAAQA